MKQGISDSDHAALIAGAYKFPKRELGLIDNTEMGALNPMSLAEVQNIREHQMRQADALDAEADEYERNVPTGPLTRTVVADLRQRAHAIHVQLDLEDSTKRYQEQPK